MSACQLHHSGYLTEDLEQVVTMSVQRKRIGAKSQSKF